MIGRMLVLMLGVALLAAATAAGFLLLGAWYRHREPAVWHQVVEALGRELEARAAERASRPADLEASR